MQSNTEYLREQITRYLGTGDRAKIAAELGKHRNSVTIALNKLDPQNEIVKLAIKKALANKRAEERAKERLQKQVEQLKPAA